MVGNIFAYVMLLIWPMVTWIAYRRFDPAQALIFCLLGGYMFLPPLVAFDLPMIPGLDKNNMASFSALAASMFLLKDRISFLPEGVLGKLLMIAFLLCPLPTMLTNTDPVPIFGTALPAIRLYDAIVFFLEQSIALIPFILGRHYLSDAAGMDKICKSLVVAGLIYSVPILYEARMSPQLNVMFYGFFQHDFVQSIRYGGFRPFVFMPHGLWVAFFAFMCFAAAAVRYRVADPSQRGKALIALIYLCVILIFCRSMGPWIYALILGGGILIMPRRLQMMVAVSMVAVALFYPMLRSAQIIPIESLISNSHSLDQERGQSLAFRIMNEELLLKHALERPWFGWGGFGRNLLYDAYSGQMNVISDGGWIISLGMYGWFGYLAEFGLLALPIFSLWAVGRRVGMRQLTPAACTVTLILAANIFDLLPNDTQIPFTWLLVGATLGYAERLKAGRSVDDTEVIAPPPAAVRRRTVI